MTVLNVAQLVLLGILTLVMGVPAILLALLLPGKERKGKLFLVVSKTYSRIALWFFRIKVEERGKGNIVAGKAYVFMSNHISHADSPALALVISHPLHWVFKKELAKIPVFGWVLLACGQIMVDRSDPEKSRAALEEALSGLSGNSSVMIYPEGTRSRDGSLQPFKKGGFWMALQVGLPIVPVRVSGSREVVAADTLRIRPGTVTVEIFPPIETRGKTTADIPDLMARVRKAMLSGTTDPA
ncbi:MAG: 1-acyl-sn-glycerol-3-phosphate acyltransferase [Deltaproteobacteria bacterium]|nr:1-acyl-sn-glycerol-3-phosphate acyltransferase [Deltaproteobacteria bacterium]MDH3382690.1 1-acyl-sn-glycerol-3-phosphate acyltransferase [Deltaproteobacteria bacterium]